MKAFEGGQNRAELLLMKRKEFAHEDEVRVIYVEERDLPKEEGLIRVQIKPNEVFDEVMYDPRLETFERRERQAEAEKLGLDKSKVFESRLYQKVWLNVVVDRLPPES